MPVPRREMSSCRSGEAGGKREAAAGKKSPRWVSDVGDVRGCCDLRVGTGRRGALVRHEICAICAAHNNACCRNE